jgi:hydroxymethylglutaryl-CoA synthase
LKTSSPCGICGFGAYLPIFRISSSEVARAWGRSVAPASAEERSVASLDEDVVTMSVEASRYALQRAGIDARELGAVLVGTCTEPYQSLSCGAIVGNALGVPRKILAANLGFMGKSGTEALQSLLGLVGSGMIGYGLGVAADVCLTRPGDGLEQSGGAGSAALVVGRVSSETAAHFEGSFSLVSELPDSWRRSGESSWQQTGRFSSDYSLRMVVDSCRGLMEELGLKPEDFSYLVLQQPSSRFAVDVARSLGFSSEKVKAGSIFSSVGNLLSASSLVGLCAVLDVAQAGERILLASYGSGAGSDAFSIVVDRGIVEKRSIAPSVASLIGSKRMVDYPFLVRGYRDICG